MEYFGIKLKAIRQEHGITQKQLADVMGLAVATISSYETGGNYPSADVLIRICKYFDISADYMLGLSDTREFNMMDLTDEQYQTITSLITQFRRLNNIVDINKYKNF